MLALTLSTRLASSLVEQVQAVADVTDNRTVPNAALAVAALRGCENYARQLITSATKGPCCQPRRHGPKPRALGHCGLRNALGRYQEAFAAASEELQQDLPSCGSPRGPRSS